jgi:membrane protein YdbS with pleckstrin-like domain
MVFKKRKNKISLTHDEEFQLFKLIVDKYLWLGTIGIMGGIFMLLNKSSDWGMGALILLISVLILLMFTSIIFRHFNFKKLSD